MDDNDEFVFVDEKSYTDLIIERSGNSPNKTTFTDVTQFAALEFIIDNYSYKLEIKDIGNVFASEVPLAQIIRWKWDDKGAQVISETKTLTIGAKLEFTSIQSLSTFVVRILKKREMNDKNPCPPNSSPDDDLTVKIGDNQIAVSAAWLMSLSPVINRMLRVEMKEKQQRALTLDELGVDMELFTEFLIHISPKAVHEPILPGPKNVLLLLKLADYFQMDLLKLRCEKHLINCVEIPLIDRFLLTKQYGLTILKNYFLHLNVDKLRAFFKANRAQLLPIVSNDVYALLVCNDVWMDILPFFDYAQLGLKLAQISPRFDFLVYKYFDCSKSELTIWSEIKIRKDKNTEKPTVSVQVDRGVFVEFPLPGRPLPNKICFNFLRIEYIDHSVIEFLRSNQQIFDKRATNFYLYLYSPAKRVNKIWDVFAREIWPIFAPSIRQLGFPLGYHLDNLRRLISPTFLSDLNLSLIESGCLLPEVISSDLDGPNVTSAGQALCQWLHSPRTGGKWKQLACFAYNVSATLEWVNNFKKRCTISEKAAAVQCEDENSDNLNIVQFVLNSDNNNCIGPLSPPTAGQSNEKFA
ncbi:hypothetical protein niasHS_009251 [Heterodera schachtii]|uniref:BTB domain-containing protein n=2 Tax=Heterodera TaxID=34509 RepID=A0ABD2J3Y7_HETSC